MNSYIWVRCDSDSDRASRLEALGAIILEVLSVDEPNSFGFFLSESTGFCIPVSYFETGIEPEIIELDGKLLIGASDFFVAYSLSSRNQVFSYRMPSLYRDFLGEFCGRYVILDETGFVVLSNDGKELWTSLLDDIVDYCEFIDGEIFGSTMEGEKFSLKVPEFY